MLLHDPGGVNFTAAASPSGAGGQASPVPIRPEVDALRYPVRFLLFLIAG
jgi:hypothetical protein